MYKDIINKKYRYYHLVCYDFKLILSDYKKKLSNLNNVLCFSLHRFNEDNKVDHIHIILGFEYPVSYTFVYKYLNDNNIDSSHTAPIYDLENTFKYIKNDKNMVYCSNFKKFV